MIRRLMRLGFRLTLIVGAALALSKVVQSRRQPQEPFRPQQPFRPPEPAEPAPAEKPAPAESVEAEAGADLVVGRTEPPPVEPWVEPDVAGLCPTSHPVKAKLASGIFHLPGMLAYGRTRADRCYCDEETAAADGLRKAKR